MLRHGRFFVMPKLKQRRFDLITIFPETVAPYASASILGRAQKKKLIKITAHNLRDWSKDRHQKVDDTPYGGGAGMLMKVEPFDSAVRELRAKRSKKTKRSKKIRVILTAASGKLFTQKDARRLAKYDQLIFLCGRYEGVDHRVEEHVADEVFSIGNYVLTGGELPALVMIDAIARLRPGVLGAEESLTDESWTRDDRLEYPQYTRPPVYQGWKVPPILLSGNHAKINAWRVSKSRLRKSPRSKPLSPTASH